MCRIEEGVTLIEYPEMDILIRIFDNKIFIFKGDKEKSKLGVILLLDFKDLFNTFADSYISERLETILNPFRTPNMRSIEVSNKKGD